MPGFNRTGPGGQGSMTGRRMGGCTDNGFPENEIHYNPRRGFGRGYANRRGMGMGLGFRHGFRNQNFENIPDVSEKTIIENEINMLKNQLSLLEIKLSKTKKA